MYIHIYIYIHIHTYIRPPNLQRRREPFTALLEGRLYIYIYIYIYIYMYNLPIHNDNNDDNSPLYSRVGLNYNI